MLIPIHVIGAHGAKFKVFEVNAAVCFVVDEDAVAVHASMRKARPMAAGGLCACHRFCG